MHEIIENWSKNRPFSDLSEKEKQIVLAECSEEEYAEVRRLLRSAPKLHQGVEAPEHIKEKLLESLRARQNSTIWDLKIPAWTAAAALVPIFFAWWLFSSPAVRVVENTIVQKVIAHDTIRMVDTLWRDRVVLRYVPCPEQPKDLRDIPSGGVESRVPLATLPAQTGVKGTSLDAYPELMDFFVQPEK
jgi:hypothetical protein